VSTKIRWDGPVRETDPHWCGGYAAVGLIVVGCALLAVAGAAATFAIVRWWGQ
jgi:hypothetical protein